MQRLYIYIITLFGCLFNSYIPMLFGQDANTDKEILINSSHHHFLNQTKQFNIYTGVDLAMGIGFRTQTLSYEDATAIAEGSLTSKIGFFPINRLMIGPSYETVGSMTSFSAWDSYSLSARTWGGIMRYYIKGGLFGEFQYGWGKGKEQFSNDGINTSHNFRSERYTIGLGLAAFWVKNFNFEVLLRYNNATRTINDQRNTYQSGLSVTAGAGFAFSKN